MAGMSRLAKMVRKHKWKVEIAMLKLMLSSLCMFSCVVERKNLAIYKF